MYMFTGIHTAITCVCTYLHLWKCNCEQVSQVTLSRTGFGGHVRRRVFSKRVRNLAYNKHVALSHLLSAGHGLALGYSFLLAVRLP